MSTLPACPKCASAYTYEDGSMLICPSCGHEWNPADVAASDAAKVWKDANGNVLQDGDTVILRGACQAAGARRIGFGDCRGTLLAVR